MKQFFNFKTNTLRFKFSLLFCFAIITPLSVVGYYGYSTAAESLYNNAIQVQQDELGSLSDQIHIKLQQAPEDLNFLSEFYIMGVIYSGVRRMRIKTKYSGEIE